MANISQRDLLLNVEIAEHQLVDLKNMLVSDKNSSSIKKLVDSYRKVDQIELHRSEEKLIQEKEEKEKLDETSHPPIHHEVTDEQHKEKSGLEASNSKLSTDKLSIWDPFSTQLTSTPFERVPCPDIPPSNYPKV